MILSQRVLPCVVKVKSKRARSRDVVKVKSKRARPAKCGKSKK